MRTVAFCECDPYCRRVLAKHWPDVPVYDDVRTLTAARLMADADINRLEGKDLANHWRDGVGTSGQIDLICGGFPCQDISVAGAGAGITGERSGLWSEYARIIGEVRPRYVIVENVAALLGRGLATVLGDLAALGFDAEWHCIPASAVGAPHRRDRVWIVAYAGRLPSQRWRFDLGAIGQRDWWQSEPDVGRVVARLSPRMDGDLDANAAQGGTGEILHALRNGFSAHDLQWPIGGFGRLQTPEILLTALLEHTGSPRPLGNVSLASAETSQVIMRGVWFDGSTACPSCRRRAAEQRAIEHPDLVCLLSQLLACDCGSTWLDRAGTPSVASRVDRLRALGNAVVPAIPEIIGRAIMSSIARRALEPKP